MIRWLRCGWAALLLAALAAPGLARAAEPLLPTQTFEEETLDAAPSGWQPTGEASDWVVKETLETGRPGRAIAATAVGADAASYLTRAFPETRAPRPQLLRARSVEHRREPLLGNVARDRRRRRAPFSWRSDGRKARHSTARRGGGWRRLRPESGTTLR